MINRIMSVKRPNIVSLKPSPNPVAEDPWHSQPEMMRSTWPSNSICFFWISCMSEGKNVKLAFHAVVANCCGNLVMNSLIFYAATCLAIGSMSTYKYFQTTIPNCSRASKLVPIPPKSSSNVIPSLGGVQVIGWRSNGLIDSPWLSMLSKLDKALTKGLWATLNLCKTSGPCWMSVGTTLKLSVAWA